MQKRVAIHAFAVYLEKMPNPLLNAITISFPLWHTALSNGLRKLFKDVSTTLDMT